jgi:hypothetical protein
MSETTVATGHPSEFEIRRYIERTIDADGLLRVDDHLAVCDICREFAASLCAVERRMSSVVIADRSASAPVADVRWSGSAWTDLAAAAAVLVAVGGGWWMGLSNFKQPAPAIAQAEPAKNGPALSPLTDDERRVVDGALASGELPRAAVLASLNPPASVLMGAAGKTSALAPMKPLGTVVDQAQPVFQWTTNDAGAEYRVSIFDAMFNKVAESPWLPLATLWTPDQPLTRGATYTWQITSRVNGLETTAPQPPAREARFQVTSANEHHRLENLRNRVSGAPLAVLLSDAGLLDEAAEVLANADASPDTVRLEASLAKLRQ